MKLRREVKKPKAKRLWALPKKVEKPKESRRSIEAKMLEHWLNTHATEPVEVEEDGWL